MKEINLIAAVAENWVIGNGPDIPWKIKGDLPRFKRITMDNSVIMGRKTFETLPKPFEGRENIIVTRDTKYKADGAIVVNTIEDAIKTASKPIYVAGGGQIYHQMMPLCHHIYLTWVNMAPPGDILFPVINYDDWQVTYKETLDTHQYINLSRK